MRRSFGIGILALASWLSCSHAQQVPVVQRPSFAAMGYEAAHAGGISSPHMEAGPLVNPTAEGPWLNGPYQVDTGCGNCGGGNCGGGNCGGGNCVGGCQPQRRHGQGPYFSDTVCDDCDPCFPQSFPVYMSLFGGWSDAENFESKQLDPVYSVITEISGASLGDDYAGGGAIGWMVHPLARTELEFTYRQHGAEDYHIWDYEGENVLVSRDSFPASGQIQGYSTMWNFVIHTEPRRLGCASLYAGGGIGLLFVDGGFSTATEDFVINDASFAYQFIGGLNYVISNRVDSFVEYRYLGADHLTVDNLTSNVTSLNYSYDSNAIFFGLRFGR